MSRHAGASRPRKRFGQHFLERAWAEKVVKAIAPSDRDVFLEIGPGRGAITRPLAAAARHVVAVEIDRDLATELAAAELPRTTVVIGDILGVSLDDLQRNLQAVRAAEGRVRIAGNLPYNVASPILFRLCQLQADGLAAEDATLMLQREVADRLTASAGTGDYGVLTVLIRHVAHVDRLLDLPPGAFRPPPRVRSTVIRLRFHPPDPMPADMAVFTALVRHVFTRRRKTLANALLAHPGLDTRVIADVLSHTGLDGRRRPETLGIDEFVRLSDSVPAARVTSGAHQARPVL